MRKRYKVVDLKDFRVRNPIKRLGKESYKLSDLFIILEGKCFEEE